MSKIGFYKQGNVCALGDINKNMVSYGYSRNVYVTSEAGSTKLSVTQYPDFTRYTCTTLGSSGGRYGLPVGASSTGVLVQGNVYTWSCDVRASINVTGSTNEHRMGMEGGGMLQNSAFKLTTEWKRITKTWTQTSSYAFVIYPSGALPEGAYMDIKNLKIEEGSKATPFTLPENESGITGNSIGFIERGILQPPSFYKNYIESTEFIEI